MMTRIQLIAPCVIMLAVLAFFAHPAGAQGSAFTYQGLLNNGVLPANGLHDFRFRLFDAAADGAQLGQTVCFESVVVVNGVFNVMLDFGDQFVTTGTRHLEIHVRQEIGQPCTDDFGYVLLSPRQRITPAPQASHAQSAFALSAPDGSPADAVIVDNAGNVGIGTSAPEFKLDVRGGPILVQNSGDQADLLWLASDRSWVFRQEGTGSGTALKLQSIGGGGNKNFIIQTDGGVGINTTSPLAKLEVEGEIRLGTTQKVIAAGGEENLRIIRGHINSNGSIRSGSGFSVQRSVAGVYTVTFVNNFATTPSVTATSGGNLRGVVITSIGLTQSGVTFDVYDPVTEQAIDKEFSFIAIGSR